MGCISERQKQHKGAFKQIELRFLKMMYDDVAMRSTSGLLTRQNFYIFFHINGLWGQQIFDRFDRDKSGKLSFEEFQQGVEDLVKGSFRKKVRALFDFYDIDRSGNISYAELLKMLYSYPKEQLKSMFQDEKFLKAMDRQDLELIKSNNMTGAIIEVQQPSEDHTIQFGKKRRNSEYIGDNVMVMTPQPMKVEISDEEQETGGFGAFTAAQTNKFLNVKLPPISAQYKTNQAKVKRGGSMTYAQNKLLSRNKVRITSNISMLVKKYAAFLFEEQKLDVDTDRLNVQQFAKIIEGHEKIFASYFEGFHNYIWEVEGEQPQFITNTSWIEGQCIQYYQKEDQFQSKYLRFYKNTIFVFKRKKNIEPDAIKNMEGLLVQEYSHRSGKIGFIVKHREGIYPQKAYLFQDKQTQANWMRQLSTFKNISLLQVYLIQQKIGAGNFSIVYKGAVKKTGQIVAIKSIQKFKLSVSQKQVIKNECGILQRCIHPNIVRFIQKTQTKTHLYIVTQLLNQGALDQYVKKKVFLDQYEASIIIKQLIQTVLYLNSLGLIHRDLKPQNILIRKRKDKDIIERIKLIDFGFAIYKNALKTMPQKQKFVGTPNYVAPEVLRHQEIDMMVDNFSIGVIMYFMISGSLPFDSVFPQEIAKNTCECILSLDNAHWSNVSQQGKQFLNGLVTKKQNRLSLSQAIKHPWIVNFKDLKAYTSKNKRNSYL